MAFNLQQHQQQQDIVSGEQYRYALTNFVRSFSSGLRDVVRLTFAVVFVEHYTLASE